MKYGKWVALACALTLGSAARADDVLVAAAANFTDAARELAPLYLAKTGHSAKFSFGASGKFATQIENGAPFEVLLSADAERPQRLEQEGLGINGTRFVYAIGKLALWSPTPGYVDAQGAVLKTNAFHKIAIANPKAAPYGQAAIETLQHLGVWEQTRSKTVQGENIAQTFQFVETGNAQLGFIALSQVLALPETQRGSWWAVPATLYTPIDQQAILLTKGAKNPAAKAFLDFLKSEEAKTVIMRYGYGVPTKP